MKNHIGIYGIPDDGSRYSPLGNTHDHGVASVTERRCEILELERYTRKKHDNGLPARIMEVLRLLSRADDELAVTSSNYYDRSTTAIKSSELSYDMDNAKELWESSERLCSLK